jgi:hypothetical protein
VTMLQEMPPVAGCSVTGYGYNHDVSCHAGAITIGGDHAHCGTFIDISTKGGLDVQGHVGACHRSECRHNSSLECHADGVRVGPGQDVADCLTYEPAG